MLAVIITIIFAIGVAYFATLNTSQVLINVPSYSMSVPLYFVVLASILLGFIFAWVLHLMNAFNSFFAMQGKNRVIKKEKKVNAELTSKVRDLETEKTKLETEKKSGFNR
ncbi:MAG: LapA family protein [Candidatus Levybacteria bacterium]|nr:LapA family protein [Candidatus Levybacteria bacterium]